MRLEKQLCILKMYHFFLSSQRVHKMKSHLLLKKKRKRKTATRLNERGMLTRGTWRLGGAAAQSPFVSFPARWNGRDTACDLDRHSFSVSIACLRVGTQFFGLRNTENLGKLPWRDWGGLIARMRTETAPWQPRSRGARHLGLDCLVSQTLWRRQRPGECSRVKSGRRAVTLAQLTVVPGPASPQPRCPPGVVSGQRAACYLACWT